LSLWDVLICYTVGVFKRGSLATTEPKPIENLATDELSIDELNSVVGGTDKTPPKPKTPTPPAKPGGLFEVNDYSFGVEDV
jgi:bacteriocin-like protein